MHGPLVVYARPFGGGPHHIHAANLDLRLPHALDDLFTRVDAELEPLLEGGNPVPLLDDQAVGLGQPLHRLPSVPLRADRVARDVQVRPGSVHIPDSEPRNIVAGLRQT